MATYVLVHGAGHEGWCYQPVARLIEHGMRFTRRILGGPLPIRWRFPILTPWHGPAPSSIAAAHWKSAWARTCPAERVLKIDTGHDLMLSAPEATAAMLLRLT